MFGYAVASCPFGSPPEPLSQGILSVAFKACVRSVALLLLFLVFPSQAIILWSDLGATLVHENGAGADILGGALKRDDSSSGTLYFKFHVEPLSDSSTEEYFAGFELYEGDTERLGVGNALKAWAYSAFVNADETGKSSKVASYTDLHSSNPEPLASGAPSSYELPRRGNGRTIVFKVQYVPDGDDLVTVWLNPDLGPGANEVYQLESLITRFSVNASFDSIRLRHGGGGGGWTFSSMAIATSFSDFVDTSSAKAGTPIPNGGLGPLPFSFHSWQAQPGMPHNPIQALTQTRDGYLWLGGDDGLARFDGVRFVPFGTKAGLHGAPVRTLFGDSLGRLWIGTGGGGLVRFESGKSTTFKKEDGLPSDSITALAEDQEGKLWLGSEAGLAVYQSGRFEPLSADAPFHGKPIAFLFNDGKGNMWVGATGAGIFRFDGGKLTPLTDPSVGDLLRDPHCLRVDAGGRLWVGAGDDFVLCKDGGQWRRYRIPRHSARPYVKVLAEEPDGTFWAGSVSEGLFRFNGGKLKAVDASTGLTDNRIKSFLVDREGKLWVGTDSGLNQLRRNTFCVFGQDEGLGYGPVLGLREVAPGVIWAAKPNDGLYRWEGKTFSRLTAAGLPLRDPQVKALLVTRDGSCLVAHARGLLRFKDPQAVADEATPLGLSNLNVISLAEDPQGAIWAGTREGSVWRLAKGRWSERAALRETHPITAIVPAANALVWIGTDGGGLYRCNDEVRVHYGQGTGLSSDAIRTLCLDSRGTLWIGTAGGGLSWWRDGRLATITTREGLRDDTISQILEDDAGGLWLGGDHGIACVNKLELEKAAVGKSRPLFPRIYGHAEGMPSEECTGGFFPAGLKTKSGLLWFSTSLGVVVTQPQQHTNLMHPPAVVIEEVMVDGEPAGEDHQPQPGMLNVPPGKHRIELQYAGLGSDAPEELRFRYRLDGLDADWVEAGVRRTAFYNYLPPGVYHFQVTACDRDGVWTETGASLAVKVSPHFWQSWWIITPALLGLVISIAGTARLVEQSKLQRRLKRLEQERGLERERTRIAQDLHDEMGAKLCRISFLSEHARGNDKLPDELQHEIASISDASREVLHSLDEIVWAVNPKNDTLDHVASYIAQYAQDYFQMTGIHCELSVPAEFPSHRIPSQTRHHLFLAAHEAFTNILKHSGASQAKVSICCGASAFELTAADNGVGFSPSLGETAAEASSEGRDGLHNMARRMADIGGSCRIESQPGHGTTIRFVVPLNGVT
jgi:ligand-binding sensor domain-containing protein/signal transduction histidine kinase